MSRDDSLLSSYRSDGFVVLKRFFCPATIDGWADDLYWLVDTQLKRFGVVPDDLPQSPVPRLSRALIALWRHSPEAQGWIYDEVNRRPWMYALASNSMVMDWVRFLLGSDRIAIHPRLNMIMSMPRHEWHVAYWHQDRFYGPQHHVVCYIPLQDTGDENGGLIVAPGSHRQGLLPHQYDDELRGKNKWITLTKETIDSFPVKERLLLKAGDLMFFDGWLAHSATTNMSDDVRFAITIRYSDLSDPFFINRGWRWQDLAEAGLKALAAKEPAHAK